MRFYEASCGWHLLDLPELWRHRDLVWMLALRNVKLKYRQTAIGVAWVVIQPLVTVFVFRLLFQLIKGQPTTGDAGYMITTLSALAPWQLLAYVVTKSTESLVGNQDLLTKVYFPRVVLPLSGVVSACVDFAIVLAILIPLAVVQVGFTWSLLGLPLMIVLLLFACFALSVCCATLNAIWRDVRYAVPFVLQIGLFASPVLYETEAVVPSQWQWLYALNPVVGISEGFRWALVGKELPAASLMASSACVALLTVGSLLLLSRLEPQLADRI